MIRRCLWASCWSSNSVLNLLKLLWKPCMFVRDRFSLSQWYNWLIKAEARIVCYIAQSTFLETHIGWLQSRSTDPLWRKTERINCIFCKNLGKDLPKKKKHIYILIPRHCTHKHNDCLSLQKMNKLNLRLQNED